MAIRKVKGTLALQPFCPLSVCSQIKMFVACDEARRMNDLTFYVIGNKTTAGTQYRGVNLSNQSLLRVNSSLDKFYMETSNNIK